VGNNEKSQSGVVARALLILRARIKRFGLMVRRS